MQISATLITLAAAATLTSAAPLAARDRPIVDNFNLVAIAKDPTNSKFNNNYIYSFHTGAGMGIAAASPLISDAMTGNLVNPDNNSWQVGFTFTGNTGAPWFLTMEETGSTSGTATATIGASNAPDANGYYFTDAGLMWNNTSFQEWVICDGNFGVGQLYAVVNAAVNLPASCEAVTLKTVAAQ